MASVLNIGCDIVVNNMNSEKTSPMIARFVRAYVLTARIFLRYAFLFLANKVLSQSFMEARWHKAHLKTAKSIQHNILILKGIFIKVGQMISIMTHFLPESITQELEGLQDSVPPTPYPEVERQFLREFNKLPHLYFANFEKKPIASASLGQVHIAYTHDGIKLAVKVQYPNIDKIVYSDLKILRRICSLLDLLFPKYGIKKTYQEIREVILEELDFQNEGKNLELIQENLKEHTEIVFPKVFWEHSTSKILSLEFMEGIKISNLEGLKKLQIEPRDVAEKIIHCYCKQIFIDGVYHADPHPGNFLVRAKKSEDSEKIEPEIVMIDFGAVAYISEPMRKGMARFMEGVIKRDNVIISQAMKDMGFISGPQSEEVFDKIVEFFYERLKDINFDEIKNFKLDNLEKIEDILEFRKLDISFRDLFQSFNVPKEWALLERSLILLVGLTTHLDPKLDPMGIIIPYAEQFVLGKDRTFSDLVTDTIKEVLLGYLKLPTELQRSLKLLNQGEIKIRLKDSTQSAKIISRALNRLTYTILGLGSFGIAYTLEQSAFPNYQWFYYSSILFSGLLAINFLKKGK